MFLLVALFLQAMNAASLPMATVAQGVGSQILEPRQVVVRTGDEWQALWKSHSTEPPPVVDFGDAVVVGVFMGVQRSAGYATEIVAVRSVDAGIVVEYLERRPAPGMMTAQMLTSPFHIVKLARRGGAVQFRRVETAPR